MYFSLKNLSTFKTRSEVVKSISKSKIKTKEVKGPSRKLEFDFWLG